MLVRRLLSLVFFALSVPALAQAQVVGSFTSPLSTALGGTNSTTGASVITGSDTLPATCTVRDVYVDTDQPTGAGLYVCTATNTWTNVTTGATTTPAGSGTELQYRNAGAFGALSGSSVDGGTNSNPMLTLDKTGLGSTKQGLKIIANSGATSLWIANTYNDFKCGTDASSNPYCGAYRAGGVNMVLETGPSPGACYAFVAGYDGTGGTVGMTAPDVSGVYGSKCSYRTWATSYTKTLVDATATSFLKGQLSQASTVAGGKILVTAEAVDASNRQVLTHELTFNAYRLAAGDVVSTLGDDTATAPAAAASSGTLTCTYSKTDVSDGVIFKATCDTSLTPTTFRIRYQVTGSNGFMSWTPQ